MLRETLYTTIRSLGDLGTGLQLLIVVGKDTFKETNFLKSVQRDATRLQLKVNNLVLI